MKNKNFRRLISILLCVTLIASFLPSFTSTAINSESVVNRVADDATWDEWKNLFGVDHPSTENAGAVWTDKSVFTPNALPKEYTDANGTLIDTGDNFLVALSAIASNKEIVGYSTIPTDTVLVLDVSGSMDAGNPTRAAQMVSAANDAIRDLLALNYHNRIGVVLYSGNSSAGSATYQQGTALLMPLDRYEIRVSGNNIDRGFLYLDGTTVRVRNNVYNDNGSNSFDTSKTVVGGTYIQAGLHMAMTQFKGVSKADTFIQDGIIQGGTKRMPITVLMSDGAPTLASTNYTNIGTSNVGNGISAFCETPAVGFLTQLTAAYVKSEIEAHYETDSLFYSLGVGVGNNQVANAVLDPSKASDGSQNYWESYFNLSNNEGLKLTVPGTSSGGSTGNPGTKEVTVYRNAVITRENYLYTDEYFTAEGDGLAAGFEDIVNEIYIQSRYYATSLEGGNPDFSGYITYTDRIGEYMEVKDIKGILLNGHLYTGEMLSSKIGSELGTIENPTELGREFLNSVKTRLGITDNTEVYRLVNNAWRDKQLYYGVEGGKAVFSNYIGWYAYADGTYAGYYNEGTTTVPEGLDTDGDGVIDKKVVYANKSYGLLGEATGSIKDSDMMFMSIQVHTNIETGEQSLIWKIPAALTPMVTYKISVEGNVINDNTNVLDVEIVEATPVRLLYEVGLHSGINELNVGQIVEAEHIDADGNRVFWSNYFDITSQSHDDHIVTHAEFIPNEDNERYYYVDIAPIYAAEGDDDAITTAPAANGTYFTKKYTYSTTSDKPIVYYEEISADDLAEAVYNNTLDCYVIPDHIYNHPKPDELHKNKAVNRTDSAYLYYYPQIIATNAYYEVSTHHGNNGKLTVAPAQGIAISKTIDQIEVGASQEFKFRITLTAPQGVSLDSEYAYVLANIGETEGETGSVRVNNGVIEVDLSAGKTIYITDIPEGTVYTVEEISSNSDYMVKNVHVNGVMQTSDAAVGVVSRYVLDDVDFLNTPTSEGELIITKEVTHPFVTTPAALANKVFTVNVKLTGDDVANKTFVLATATGEGSVTTNANGEFTVTLKAGESASVKGVPAETTYTITESNMPDGFELDSNASSNLSGEIPADSNIVATVVNDYEYASVDSDIDVVINKELSGRDWLDSDAFEFEVLRYDSASRAAETKLYGVTLTKNKKNDTYALDETYTTEGVYYYLIREKSGDDSIGLTYDTVVREFRVFVTDTDMDGHLEISRVENVLRTTVSGDASNGFTVTANDFVNSYAASGSNSIEINVVKHVSGGQFRLNGFKFGLYTYQTDENGDPTDQLVLVEESSLTDAMGNASFKLSYTAESVGKTFKYIVKEIDTGISGMTYDTTAYEVTVNVVDNLDGTISVNKSVEKIVSATDKTPVNIIDFTNVYTPANGELIISGNKVLQNRVQYENEFKFELYETDDTYDITGKTAIDEAYNSFDGSFSFDLLTYTAPDTHYYVVKESDTGIAGVDYDGTVYKIKVVVQQDGSAYVSRIEEISGGNSSDVTFTNTYSADPTDVILSGNKVLTGRDINDNEFEFALFETGADFVVGSTSEQVVKNITNKFTFNAINYTDAGTYYYVIKEVDNGLGGVTYDASEYHVTVVITDNGRGQLVSTVSMTKQGQDMTDIVFRNGYNAAPTTIDIDGKKVLHGAKPMVAGDYEFKLINAVTNEVLAVAYNDASGNYKFEDIVITAAGTHRGKIVESVTDLNGVTYDDTVYGFVVEIEDDLNGNLVETDRRVWANGQAVSDPNAPIVFTNSYKAANEVVVLGGTKNLDGRTLNADEFKFELYETDDTYDITGKTAVETVKNTAGGQFTFSEILIDSDVDRYFVIVENAADNLGGVTYDANVYKVMIEVTDNFDGRFIVDTSVTLNNSTTNIGADNIVFNNTYKAADTEVTFKGEKILDGRNLDANEFEFVLYETDNTYNINGLTAIESVKNDVNGKFEFDAVDITSDADRYFVIVESDANPKGGVTYDTKVYKLEVKVTDKLDGTYEVETVVRLGNNEVNTGVVFNNSYKAADTEVVFNGIKSIEGRDLVADEFKFNLYKTDNTYNVENGTFVESVKNAADGKFEFTAIDITSDDDMYFVIIEDAANPKGGVTYDTKVYKLEVKVTDKLDGTYEVETIVRLGNNEVNTGVVFNNSYKAADTKATLEGTKTLNGRKLNANEFEFKLYKTDDTYNINGLTAIETVKNGADGKFKFGDIEIKSADDLYFVIVEDDTNKADRVDYDTTVYKVKIEVTDKLDGTYDVKTIIYVGNDQKQDVTFVNVFTPKDIDVSINVQKILQNNTDKEMGLDGFDFKLVGEGKELTAKSDKDGKAGFNLVYTSNDIGKTFTYTVTELKGDVKGMVYSDAEIKVTVLITVDENGILKAEYTVGGNKVETPVVEFTNVYEGDPDIPKTGETTNVWFWFALMFVSGAGLVVALVVGKDKKENEI